MRKCIVISDSFKGTLSSREICGIAKESIPRFFPQAEVFAIPVADGGEGTVDCFLEALQGTKVSACVHGPYGEEITAAYCRSGDTAVIEMASAAGLPMVAGRADPEQTSTFGVGELIRHAVEHGAKKILLGLGGSCTNDGGCGCAAALGVRFTDRTGTEFVPVGGTLGEITRVDPSEADAFLRGVELTLICDVDHPLYGENGAAYVFAPQKGADEAAVVRLDRNLRSFAAVLQEQLGCALADVPGAGAAGGMGYGCMALLHAKLVPGIKAVLELVRFEEALEGADLVITGEGRIDDQSARGKVISGVAELSKKHGVPLLAIVGSIAEGAESAYDLGVTAMFGIDREARDFRRIADKTQENYRRTLEDVLRLLKAYNA